VYIETNVDEVDIGKVQVGQTAKVVADAFPDDVFNGEVIRIAPLGKTLQNVTTFNVIVLVKNLGGKLKAGMSTSVDVEIFRRRDVLLVPTEALKDPKSDLGRVLLAAWKEREKSDNPDSVTRQAPAAAELPVNPEETRKRFMQLSPDEQQKERERMRERVQSMSPEERQKFFGQMQARGGGTFMRRDGRGGGRRGTEERAKDVVKERLLEVREGESFAPRMVKVGASNYDYAEILDGVKEGDEIRITTVSRAKIASEQFTERMRERQSIGGINTRGATGGGRR
jgi:HlyD family secretion protein